MGMAVPYTDYYKGLPIDDVNSDGIPELVEGGYYYLRAFNVLNKTIVIT